MDRRDPIPCLRGQSPEIRRLRRELERLAGVDSTVLITGETGTGKGLAARILHTSSRRSEEPFVHVDCAALSPELVGSELFGHERGAFTGAIAKRPGRFELAAGGTLLLDEVGDLPPALQAVLLRVLQDREYERVGGSRSLPMRARVIAATHRDLVRCVRDGSFRADLYYRLRVVRLRVPPLREREGDAAHLTRVLLPEIARRMGVAAPPLSDQSIALIERYSWPGNVRELIGILEALIVRCTGGRVESSDLAWLLEDAPGSFRGTPSGPDGPEVLRNALLRARGNVSEAARCLGIPRSTLRHRIRRWGLGA